MIPKSTVYNAPYPKSFGSEFTLFDHGEGCYIFDVEGKKYLDLGSGIAVNTLGYGREDLAKAAYDQMKKIIHTSNLYTSEATLLVADKLTSFGNFAAVHFGNSGTEANEAAIKFARLYAKRKKGTGHHKIIAFESAFHGRTMGALSCTYNPHYREDCGPLVPGVEFLPYNDVETLKKTVDGTYAAIIVEVIQGEGGLKCMTKEFAKALNEVCAQQDVILIADEVQTGLTRTGYPFACGLVDLNPDIITLAKPLAGGLPLSATLIPMKVNEILQPGDHGSTFGGNPVACAVANLMLETLFFPPFIFEVQAKGEYLKKKIEGLKAQFDCIGELRGAGMLRGFEVNTPSGYQGELSKDLIAECKANGVLVLRSGTNVIRLAPPLVINEKELDEGFEIIAKSLKNLLNK
ncbi:MAG: acetylornithine/succinylornithine family transaminase [Spirochaetia bacterium]|nr:acetylornithine/succinylornithine family transaminase [Spirochaetia bacterium]